MLLVEIKDFNVLIDNKSFFDQPIKNKQESYEKLIKMKKKKKKRHSRKFIRFLHQKLCIIY